VVLTSSQVATLRSFGAGDTAFGLNVLSALCRGQPGTNVLISPVSLATGLSMAYLGARGATAAAMARVLQLPAARSGLLAVSYTKITDATRPGTDKLSRPHGLAPTAAAQLRRAHRRCKRSARQRSSQATI